MSERPSTTAVALRLLGLTILLALVVLGIAIGAWHVFMPSAWAFMDLGRAKRITAVGGIALIALDCSLPKPIAHD